MSKILKIHTIPKSLSAMGSMEKQCESFCADWLKIDAFKDWLEPVKEDQYKAKCSECNVILNCNLNELTRHGEDPEHLAVQNSRKRKSVIGHIIGKMNVANSSGSSGGQPRKVILLRRTLNTNVKSGVTGETVSEDSEGDMNLKVISSPSIMEKALHINESLLAQQRKRKSFRLEWLDVPEFKDWLSPDPDSPYKARCLACNTVLNAGKSELEKHAAGARHEKAVEALQRMVLEQQAWDEANDMEDEDEEDIDDMYDSTVNTGTQTLLSGEEMLVNLRQEQNQQLEVMNRIAASVEKLATSSEGILENLVKNQETLTNILVHFINK